MKKIIAVVILTIGITSDVSWASYDWFTNPANGHQYALTSFGNWLSCETEAVSVGGHLVTINDTAERDWLLNPSVPFGSSFAPGYSDNVWWNGVWCGLKYVGGDKSLSSSWEWVSGETLTCWLPAPSAFPYKDGIHMTLSGRYNPHIGTFNNNPDHDTDPAQYMRGVIEVVPEPCTLVLVGLGSLLLRKRKK